MSAMVAVWSITYLLHSTLLIALVWGAARWIRSASVRDTLWKVALVGGIVTASVQTFAPVERFVPPAGPVRVTFDRSAFERVAPALAEPVVRDRSEPASEAPASLLRLPPARTLAFGAWCLVAFVLLLRIAIGHRRFLRFVRDRTELLSGPERERLDRTCRRAGVSRPVRLTQTPELVSPVAMLGWEIVIPASFDRLSADQRETILAHELSHLVRRDPLWLTLGEAIKAVLFFQPLNWLAQARTKETAEFLCDDAAVLQTGQRKALAETLAELAASSQPAPPVVAGMAEGGSNLMLRVTRVLHSNPVAPLRLSVRLALGLAVLAVTVTFAPGMVAGVVRASSNEKANYLGDATLSRTFESSEGSTHISLEAHEAEAARDGSYVRLTKRDSFLRATQTSERGPKREIEIVRGSSGGEDYRYLVDGKARPWDDDAREIIAAAFRVDKSLSDEAPVEAVVVREKDEAPVVVVGEKEPAEPREPQALPSGRHEWSARIEVTGTRDTVPTYLRVKAQGLKVDYDTGAVDFEPGGRIDVVEKNGALERTFHMDADGKAYEGTFDSTEKETWLTEILRKHTALPGNVIETIVR
jgi:beta-lactamase regulating signal transducer with metallopeptidase domain